MHPATAGCCHGSLPAGELQVSRGVTDYESIIANGGSYVESLVSRIHSLEAQLAPSSDCDQAPGLAGTVAPAPSSPHAQDGHTLHQSKVPDRTHASSSEMQQENLLLEAMRDMGYVSPPSTDGPLPPDQSSDRALSFYSFFAAAIMASGSNPGLPVCRNDLFSGTLGSFYHSFFRQTVASFQFETEPAFQQYLSFCSVWAPFQERELFTEAYETVCLSHITGSVDQLVAKWPEKIVLVYMAIATGYLQLPDHRHKENYSNSLAFTAAQVMQQVIAQSGEFTITQSLVAWAIFSLYSPFGGSTWHLTGLAVSKCVPPGMQDRDIWHSTGDPRRLSFWTLYILDT